MNKGTVSFLLAMILFVVVAVTWSKVGGFAQAYQERNVKEWADYEPQFVPPTACQSCHKGIYSEWVVSKHRTVNCQVCHGPALKHFQGEEKPVVDTSRELCGYCHNKISGRRADFPMVAVEQHFPDQPACSSCHNNHAPGQPRQPQSGGR